MSPAGTSVKTETTTTQSVDSYDSIWLLWIYLLYRSYQMLIIEMTFYWINSFLLPLSCDFFCVSQFGDTQTSLASVMCCVNILLLSWKILFCSSSYNSIFYKEIIVVIWSKKYWSFLLSFLSHFFLISAVQHLVWRFEPGRAGFLSLYTETGALLLLGGILVWFPCS